MMLQLDSNILKTPSEHREACSHCCSASFLSRTCDKMEKRKQRNKWWEGKQGKERRALHNFGACYSQVTFFMVASFHVLLGPSENAPTRKGLLKNLFLLLLFIVTSYFFPRSLTALHFSENHWSTYEKLINHLLVCCWYAVCFLW